MEELCSDPATADRFLCGALRLRGETRLGRQEYRIETHPPGEIVLLLVSRDEVVETEFHHCDVQKVGGLDRNGLAVPSGEFQRRLKHLIIHRSSLSCASSSVAVGPLPEIG